MMTCSVCNTNPAVAKCSVCSKVVCKACGVLCPSCKKPICRSHLLRGADGKIVCQGCTVKKQTVIPSPPSSKVSEPPKIAVGKREEKVSLSFEDLSAELGDVSIGIKEMDKRGTDEEDTSGKGTLPKEMSADERVENPFKLTNELQKTAEMKSPTGGYKHLKRKPSDDPNEFRILTASSPKPTPMWVSGLISGILAFLLSLPLIKNSNMPFFPSLFSYSVILLAGGSIVWNGYGLFFTEDIRFNRMMCIPGLILAVIAVLIGIIGLR